MACLPREGGACWASHACGPSSLLAAAGHFLCRHKTWILAAAAVVGTAKIYGVVKRRRLRAEWDSAGPNVVVLHTLPPGKVCPSCAPAALKLETFLRLANIKYQIDLRAPFGPKRKTPWVTINGEDIADSEIIIERLQKMFNKYPDADLPGHERGVGVAMQVMFDEHFYWGVMSWRHLENKQVAFLKVQKIPAYLVVAFKFFRFHLAKTLYAQGIGRHSYEEVHSFMKKDLEAVSLYLGTKAFLHGEAPGVADCAVFAGLCQVVYNSPGSPYERYIKEDLPNLLGYVERVRARLWPDWKDCLAKDV